MVGAVACIILSVLPVPLNTLLNYKLKPTPEVFMAHLYFMDTKIISSWSLV